MESVTKQIQQACAEAREEGIREGQKGIYMTAFSKGYDKGFSDAREKAAKICDACGYTDCRHDRCDIAERIRAVERDK